MENVQTSVQRHAVNNFSSTAFVEMNQGRYVDIWNAMGRQWTHLFIEAAWAVNSIPGTEHGILNPNFQITEEQIDNTLPSLIAMKWFKGLQLVNRMNDFLLRLGAKYKAMVDGAEMIFERLARDMHDERKRVVFRKGIYGLFGQRPRVTADKNGVRVDGSVQEIYDELSDNVRAHPWVIKQMKLMESDDCELEFKGAFATEFELGILAFIVAAKGYITVGEYVPAADTTSLPGVPLRTIESCTLRTSTGIEVIALNAPAVERDYGPPRPTSISTMEYFLSKVQVQEGDNITVVTARIHGLRIAGDIARLVYGMIDDVEVRGYSASVAGNVRPYFNHALAESVNQLSKSVEETLNRLRSPGYPPIDTRQVRRFLNRIHLSPTMQTISQILMEVTLGLVPIEVAAAKQLLFHTQKN